MADIDHNRMRRCDSQDACMVPFVGLPGELAEACGEMNGVKS